MAESTLAQSKNQFEQTVGLFLGFGRGANYGDTAWTTQQQAVISECVDEGHRIFYYPEPDESGQVHDWSFLHPTATVLLSSGASSLTLPDDFGGIEGPVTLLGSNVLATLVRAVSEPFVRQAFQVLPGATGQPECVAVAPLKGTTTNTGQRMQLLVYPAADAAYTMQFQYYLLPDALSSGSPYSYGGAAHASTIRAACLKVAENWMDDTRRGEGPHSLEFKARLAASVGVDRKNKPQSGGLNCDRSDQRGWQGPWDRSGLYANQTTTFNNTAY